MTIPAFLVTMVFRAGYDVTRRNARDRSDKAFECQPLLKYDSFSANVGSLMAFTWREYLGGEEVEEGG